MTRASLPTVRLGIVLYRNAPRELRRLATSLAVCAREPGTPSFDVAFIDNSPTAELEAVVAGLELPVTYRHASHNLGFGAAQNVLMAEAFAAPGPAFFLCVNPDAVLHPRCIAELTEAAARLPRPGLIEALQFPDEHPKPHDPRTHATDWCSGCVLLVTRALYEAVGGFDENFFMYCEDVDLSWRARAMGFDTVIAPQALVHHYTGDRPPGGRVVEQMLVSGAYLGTKYGNARFARHCVREYTAIRGVEPAVPPATPVPSAFRDVADFAHFFHFAPARW